MRRDSHTHPYTAAQRCDAQRLLMAPVALCVIHDVECASDAIVIVAFVNFPQRQRNVTTFHQRSSTPPIQPDQPPYDPQRLILGHGGNAPCNTLVDWTRDVARQGPPVE